ncbi:MAG: phosphatase PAP2 family protein [Chloroflexi bacterium]|nr:MAG: phosphatase PAP2 family protein [Chloroflexota bacterium]
MKGAAAIKRSGAYFRGRLLLLALACALLVAGLTVFVVTNPRPAVDASIARAVQSIDVGPMSPVLDFYRQIGGPYALEAEAVVFAIILTINRASWRLLISGSLVSGWYFLLVRLISRPRPTVPDVLRVTEHPGASSYPSGHMMLFVFYAVILMTCLGLKFVPRRWQPLGWGIAALFIILGGFSRIYSGAHWPTDVLGGTLIAVAWLSFVMSIRWISDPVLEQAPRSTAEKAVRPAA